jgi:hypothetical protein
MFGPPPNRSVPVSPPGPEVGLPLMSPSYDLGLTEEAIRATWWDHFHSLQSRHTEEATSPIKAWQVGVPMVGSEHRDRAGRHAAGSAQGGQKA